MKLFNLTRATSLSGLIALGALSAVSVSAQSFGVMSSPVKRVPITDSYIVVYKDAAAASTGMRVASSEAGRAKQAAQIKIRQLRAQRALRHEFAKNFTGFSANMTQAQAKALAADPNVAFVEQDAIFTIAATQTDATWGLDRIDQRALPLNKTYNYGADGTGVRAYILDTGIRATHTEVAGRVLAGYNTTSTNTTDTNDCHGHGTHVAATVGGRLYGVSKAVSLVPVRVLSCNGSGTLSGILAGMEWVANQSHRPAVVNMSLGGGASLSIDNAVQNLVNKGISVVVAAGNQNADACNSSPARAANAITVGAVTNLDARASFSNYGSCVDIFAPGASITSAGIASDTELKTYSGTSMASPHVAGVVANYLSSNNTATPGQVADFLKNKATKNRLTGLAGSPNALLHSDLNAEVDTTPAPALPKIAVSNLNSFYVGPWFNKQWLVAAQVRILDTDGGAVSGAVVTLKEASGGAESSFNCTTDSRGYCSFYRTYSRSVATLTISVQNVAKDGQEYDASKNKISSITVNRPRISWWWPF